jgi:hypothetical protein
VFIVLVHRGEDLFNDILHYDPLGSIFVGLANNLPSLFRLLDILKKTEIFMGDHAFLYKDVKVDEAMPELLAKKEDGNGLYLMRLYVGRGLSSNRLYSSHTPSKNMTWRTPLPIPG